MRESGRAKDFNPVAYQEWMFGCTFIPGGFVPPGVSKTLHLLYLRRFDFS